MACKRGVVPRANVALDSLVSAVLQERLDKSPSVRLSKWSQTNLSDEQTLYASLDVIKPVEMYFKLLQLPDLTRRCLSLEELPLNSMVDVMPPHGSIAVLATVSAVGTIDENREWKLPIGCAPRSINPSNRPPFSSGFTYEHVEAISSRVNFSSYGSFCSHGFCYRGFGARSYGFCYCGFRFCDSCSSYRVGSYIFHWDGFYYYGFRSHGIRSYHTCGINGYGSSSCGLCSYCFSCSGFSSSHRVCSYNFCGGFCSYNSCGFNSYGSSSYGFCSCGFCSCGCSSYGFDSSYNVCSYSFCFRSRDGFQYSSIEDVDENVVEAGSDDLDVSSLNTEEIALCRAASAAASASAADVTTSVGDSMLSFDFSCDNLDTPPTAITDVYSSVVGDAFHFMDRPKVPVHHVYKKSYFVALRNAWFVWDGAALDKVKATLRSHGATEEEIEAKMYFDAKWFRERVPRTVPPPSKHYWRVRAVYMLFGPMIDTKTGAPLFNSANWARANNVLKEILAGHAADIPTMEYYYYRLNARGEPAVDSLGFL
ncbi:hypothetical protein CYMTET_42537 [Cymbomonas tetramitiformis]|uniref:3'-5' exonuclease domain-containing protein n=1 Tax=Cymbomonas tetramitiformis TaxID=36881 RepID=A0AAE0C3Z2_9CHLO|nr:hypothetical protein CYMTET_42537 [Cymbomonas tetramitiformis]